MPPALGPHLDAGSSERMDRMSKQTDDHLLETVIHLPSHAPLVPLLGEAHALADQAPLH